jgi:predicted enzyme related to lactoylglutathione lyase
MALGHLGEVVFDCVDPHGLALFWQHMIGGDLVDQTDTWTALVPPRGVIIGFQQVPESKVVKNRVHLDVQVDDCAAATQAAVALGATAVGPMQDEDDAPFQVMLDPEGNEFCFIVDP